MKLTQLVEYTTPLTNTPIYGVDTSGGTPLSRKILLGNANNPGAVLEDVVWTNTSSNVTVTGNTIEKTSGSDGLWDAGGVASKQLQSGDGFCQWEVDTTTGTDSLMCALSNDNPDFSFQSLDFAIWQFGNTIRVYENNSQKFTTTGVTVGDLFKVEIVSGSVEYKQNDTTFYTSLVSPTYPLFCDCSIRDLDRKVMDAKIFGNWT